MDQRVSDAYWLLAVSLGAEDLAAAEAVTNFLWESGATGVVEDIEPAARGLRAFFPPGREPADVGRGLGEYLAELRLLGISVGAGAVEVRRLPEEAWADAWRAHFRPLPVGRRLLVCPPWEVPSAAAAGPGARTLVVIEPGRAFGTGGHATTRGCLELLERALGAMPAARVLDIGTGSGILAIAAARLGAEDVRAIDVDPDAVAAALANAERNQVAARVRVTLGSFEEASPADLVLANLLGATHVAAAPLLARCCTASGRLIAGGLLVHEAPAVVGAYVPEGFQLTELVEREGWASLALSRG